MRYTITYASYINFKQKWLYILRDIVPLVFKLFLNNRKCENIQSQKSCISRQSLP